MKLPIATTEPFSFDQALTFIRRFPPCRQQVIVDEHGVTAAVAIGGRGHAFTLRAEPALTVELAGDAPREVARRAADLVSAADDLAPFYAAAAGDPAFAPIVRGLSGLHHVRFLGLEEIAVYCVMMQRTPIARAARLEQRFLDRFGLPVTVGTRTLRAMPELAMLAELSADDIADAIGHRAKAERIAEVVRGVAALGEPFLREAAYAEARDALLAIPGVGPFSAAAILLRGLGRMDELPSLAMFEREGRAIYRRAWDPEAIARRYGAHIGYWSFYLKTWTSRVQELEQVRSARDRRQPRHAE